MKSRTKLHVNSLSDPFKVRHFRQSFHGQYTVIPLLNTTAPKNFRKSDYHRVSNTLFLHTQTWSYY